MTNTVRPTSATARPDDDFREFVLGFADPLARLAFVLTTHAQPTDASASRTSDSPAPDVLATDALARVRRRWREAHESGALEFVAIEALLSNLGRGRSARGRDKAAAELGTDTEVPVDEGSSDDVDMELVRDALWHAFQHLPLRQRVPLVFADPSVASRRLAGFGVPASFASQRRQEVSFDAALLGLRAALRTRGATAAADLMTDDEMVAVLGDAIREHAADELAPVDPYPIVLERARKTRRRTGVLAAAVVVVVAVAGIGVVKVSTPDKARAGVADPETASSVSPSRAGVLPNPALPGDGQVAGRPAAVVNWPVRGNAAGEPVLLANVRALFLADHPDVTGPAQVLLAADTPAFRVAYVTATSASGVVQGWFYGPVGSSELKEGAASFGGSLVANASVIASGLVDSAGHTELVVIAPPTTTGMSIADFDFSRPIGSFQALPEFGGVALKDIATGSVATLELHVIAGGQRLDVDHMPVIDLGTPLALAAVHAQPSVGVEHGQADPILLAEALQVASVWAQQDPSVAAHPVVVWGGTDAAGTQLVVLRIKGKIVDVVILEWSGDAPGLHGEILMHSTAPDVPIAFAYRAVGGTRIGVIASHGATHAVLDFEGKASAPVALDATGFASFPVTNPSPPPSNDASSDLEVVAQVRLFDASGHLLETVPEPPSV